MKKEEKRYGLLKGILLLTLVAIILSWLIPIGQFGGAEFATDNTLKRVGLTDLSWLVYYGLEFSLDKVVLLLAIGGFYGIITKTKAYDNLTSSIAKKMSNKKVAVVVFSVIIALLSSILTQTFVVLIFVPFIISIMNKMKLDKMTILATTFGSMLVGLLGATYGTEGLQLLEKYSYFTAEGFNRNATVLIRFGILLIGLILFNFFTLSHMSKKDKNNETIDMFPIEEVEEKKKSIIPLAVISVLLIILVIIAFTNWSNWSIFNHTNETTGTVETIFESFHNTVMDIKIGDDFNIFSSLLGSNVGAFGTWDMFNIASILFIFTIILGICYRFKFNEFVTNFINGAKKMIKPCMILMAVYMVMTVVYMSPYLATIVNKLLSLTDGFNLATTSLSLFICNLFSANLDFTGYVMTAHLAAEYPTYMNAMYVMISSIFGFVSFFAPTSLILGLGLTSLDVKFGDWLKYIWKFLLGMLICLLIIFILMTVI